MKISVVIPVYNVEKFINKTIDSLINQSIFKKLEIIFVNDGSTDNSLEILNKLNYSNIKVIDKKNGGVSSARNVGIENATCPYISFIDADDYIESDYFEKLLNIEYDLIVTGYVAEYNNSSIFNKSDKIVELNNNTDIIYNFIYGLINPNCWGKLYKKELIGGLRFDESLSHSEDRLFVYNYLKNCSSVLIDTNYKYHYNVRYDSAMRKCFNIKMFGSIEVMEMISNDIKDNYYNIYPYSLSSLIDSKCRVLGNIYYFKENKKYKEEVKKLKKDIKSFGIKNKKKYSNKKHFIGYILMIISPRLYNLVKNDMKGQYK